MQTIVTPIKFDTLDLFQEWTTRFEKEAKEICSSYKVMDLWIQIIFWKDENKLEYAIVSMGAWPEKSDQYRAQNKILEVWDEMFGIRGFFK